MMGIMSLIIRKADHLMKSKDQQIKELQKQVKELKQENLKLTVENEFVKKLSALVSQRKNQKPKK